MAKRSPAIEAKNILRGVRELETSSWICFLVTFFLVFTFDLGLVEVTFGRGLFIGFIFYKVDTR
jgi:hypothetical protein